MICTKLIRVPRTLLLKDFWKVSIREFSVMRLHMASKSEFGLTDPPTNVTNMFRPKSVRDRGQVLLPKCSFNAGMFNSLASELSREVNVRWLSVLRFRTKTWLRRSMAQGNKVRCNRLKSDWKLTLFPNWYNICMHEVPQRCNTNLIPDYSSDACCRHCNGEKHWVRNKPLFRVVCALTSNIITQTHLSFRKRYFFPGQW